jgi:hypothetical protein
MDALIVKDSIRPNSFKSGPSWRRDSGLPNRPKSARPPAGSIKASKSGHIRLRERSLAP